MENFINTQLQPTETCIVCTEPFSATHQPVALGCKHIFGHQCIRNWLRKGRGNTNSCPFCRYQIFDNKGSRSSFDANSIWEELNEQPSERLHELLGVIWSGLQKLWGRKTGGKFSVTELLDEAIIPALLQTSRGGREQNAFLDCYNLVAASWDSLGRPNVAHGLAIPLIRLSRLMSQASVTLPKWLTTVQRMNMLFWKANWCLAINVPVMSWDLLIEAADLDKVRYFPLLHLYTVLISQSIAHLPEPRPWPIRRHELMNLVVERCCTKIGGSGAIGDGHAVGPEGPSSWWSGSPSSQFKDTLVMVYEDLRRYQRERGRMSLRGYEGEEHFVRGIWAMAIWSVKIATK